MILVDAALKACNPMTAIDPLKLEIPEGGITALVGPNEVGESTLLTMVGRLLGTDFDTIEVAGMNVATTKSKDLTKVLSAPHQESHFMTRLAVHQLVGSGRSPHPQERLSAEDIEVVEQAISFLHPEEIADRFIDELSGNQRQRAYVAMVLAQDTRCVLLNGPLNSLSMVRSVQMMQHLRRTVKELGHATVTVLYDISFAATYTNMTITMKSGQVATNGSPEELSREEVPTGIFGTSVEITPGPHGPVTIYL